MVIVLNMRDKISTSLSFVSVGLKKKQKIQKKYHRKLAVETGISFYV